MVIIYFSKQTFISVKVYFLLKALHRCSSSVVTQPPVWLLQKLHKHLQLWQPLFCCCCCCCAWQHYHDREDVDVLLIINHLGFFCSCVHEVKGPELWIIYKYKLWTLFQNFYSFISFLLKKVTDLIFFFNFIHFILFEICDFFWETFYIHFWWRNSRVSPVEAFHSSQCSALWRRHVFMSTSSFSIPLHFHGSQRQNQGKRWTFPTSFVISQFQQRWSSAFSFFSKPHLSQRAADVTRRLFDPSAIQQFYFSIHTRFTKLKGFSRY